MSEKPTAVITVTWDARSKTWEVSGSVGQRRYWERANSEAALDHMMMMALVRKVQETLESALW